MDTEKYIGKAIRVFWVDDDAWYSGTVDDYHPKKGWHVQYHDGEEEWLKSLEENVEFDEPDDFEEYEPDSNHESSPQLGQTNATNYSELEMAIISDDEPNHNKSRGMKDKTNLNEERGQNASKTRGMSTLGTAEDETTQSSLMHVKAHSQSFSKPLDRTSMSYTAELEVVEGNDKETYRRRDYKEKSLHVIENNVAVGRRSTERIVDLTVPSKGLLLLGTVFGASNLPTIDDSEIDGKCCFRVLYVEGTGASTMFRCKTPIFSSKVTDDLHFPQWAEPSGTFRFEMITPESKVDGQLQLQGQIIVAVYRVRAQGGFEFLGQACFEITDLTQNGTKESHQEGVEARSLCGEFPLIDRFDKAIGNYAEIQVHLQVAWRPSSFVKQAPNLNLNLNLNQSNVQRPSTANRPGTANTRSGTGTGIGAGAGAGVGQNDTSRQYGSGASVAGSVRPGTGRSLPPRTRPASAGPNQTSLSRGPPPVKVVSAQLRKQAEDRKRIEAQNKILQSRIQSKGTKGRGELIGSIYKTQKAEGKVSSSSANTSGGVGRGRGSKQLGPSLDEVVQSWTRLKKEVSEIEDENLLLKATLSKLKLQTKRHEITTARLKKDSKPSAASDSKNDSIIKSEQAVKDLVEDGQFTDIDDSELREVAIENFNLQQLRRGLIERARAASAACSDHVVTAANAQDAEMLLRTRIALAAPCILPPPQCEVTTDQRDLKALIGKLRNVQLDFLCAEAAKEHGFHFGPLEDAILEDRELLKVLTKKVDELQSETEVYKSDCEVTKEKLNRLIDDRSVCKIRDKIADLRQALFKLRTKKCTADLESSVNNADKEILRFNMKS